MNYSVVNPIFGTLRLSDVRESLFEYSLAIASFENSLLVGRYFIELGILYGLSDNRPLYRVARNLDKLLIPLQMV